MKRFISIVLLFAFIGTTTELHELFKIPHLLVHYFEHKGEHPGESLTSFLHEHYAHDHDNHKDEHHDKGCLPFQGEHNCHVQVAQFYQEKADFSLIPPVVNAKKSFPDSEFIPSEFLASIWQPPKV